MTETIVLLNGKPLSQCTDEEIYREWDAGMFLDVQEGLTAEQLSRMSAIEKEMERPGFGKNFKID